MDPPCSDYLGILKKRRRKRCSAVYMFNQTESVHYGKLKLIVSIVLNLFASLVSIAAFQAVYPGSIPGRRIDFFDLPFLLPCSLNGQKVARNE